MAGTFLVGYNGSKLHRVILPNSLPSERNHVIPTMSTASPFDTKPSLIPKLRDTASREEVWPDFVDRYGSLVYEWCLRWGAPAEEAEDIVQQTLLSVFLHIGAFERQGPGAFRAWIRQIARNVWLKIVEKSLKRRKAIEAISGNLSDSCSMRSGLAREDLLRRFDEVACEEIRSLTFERVRRRVSSNTWEAFFLCDHDRMPGKIVAERLGISLKAVHLAAIRVRYMLTEELHRIDAQNEY
ncbi:sigma-70 family RNA polymerase sigma factor [bacterium]|nr:sigma-70 family RNA polymerase sigma factor [bacterium]